MSDTNWKKVAQEAEKVRDLALEAKAAADLARGRAEQERDAARQEADLLRRQVRVLAIRAATYCTRDEACPRQPVHGKFDRETCYQCRTEWAAQQAKEG